MIKIKNSVIIILFISSCSKAKIDIIPIGRNILPINKYDIVNKCVSDCLITDTLLITINECHDKFFSIYSCNTGYLINEFGQKGRQRDEFSFPIFWNENNYDANGIVVYDLNSMQQKQININKIIETNASQDNISANKLPTQIIATLNLSSLGEDKIVGTPIISDGGNGSFFIYDRATNEKEWINYPFRYKYRNSLITQLANDCVVEVNDYRQSIISAYRYYDAINIYNTKGALKNKIRFSNINKPIEAKDVSTIDSSYPLFFTKIYSTLDHCYILRLNISINNLIDKKESITKIIKIDWEGNIKDCYNFNFVVNSFCVNSDDSKLFVFYDNKQNPELMSINEYVI